MLLVWLGQQNHYIIPSSKEYTVIHIKHNFHYRYIDSTNRKSLIYSLVINHLTDLSNDELKVMRGYHPSKGPNCKGGMEFTSYISVNATPDTYLGLEDTGYKQYTPSIKAANLLIISLLYFIVSSYPHGVGKCYMVTVGIINEIALAIVHRNYKI